MNIQSISSVADLKGKRVIVRLDFNVPIKDGKVVDTLRIDKSMATLNLLKSAGAKTIIISHIEGKGGVVLSLEPVAQYLNSSVEGTSTPRFAVNFVKDFTNKDVVLGEMGKMNDGDTILFDNLRVSDGEKNNDPAFAAYLAQFGDVYVNDAFPVCHREHASVVGVPKLLPHYAGINLMEEINHLQSATNPEHPFLFILGGAKVETKIPLIEKFMKTADHIFVGGALVNNFFKEQGLNVGKSLVSGGTYNLTSYANNPKLILPTDVVVRKADAVAVDGKYPSEVKSPTQVGDDEIIADAGPASIAALEPIIKSAKLILWNGPMGNYEDGFKDQTIAVAKLIAGSKVKAILGGGDTTAAVGSLDLEDDSTIFVSTGGGAMLQYLIDDTLPGIEALK